MPSLDEHQLLGFLVALAVVILLARLLGEFARRLGQPEVVGQLVAGDPGLALSGISWLGALLVAGLEVDERGQTRREFAQVVLAGGITTELCGWVFVAVAAAAQHGSPLLVAGRAVGLAVVFFIATVVLGRRLVDQAPTPAIPWSRSSLSCSPQPRCGCWNTAARPRAPSSSGWTTSKPVPGPTLPPSNAY